MSDDIFIKHGLGAFQQPYIGRASVNAQEPVISQRDARTPGNARQPGTYQHRTPGTYQLPANAQNPHVRDAQTPSIRNAREPNVRDARAPHIRDQQNPSIRSYQVPFTYQHRTPTIYQNSYQHQSPFTYQHRVPFITRSPRNYQVPGSYQLRTPGTYPVIAQKIVNYQHRSPAITTYRHPTTADVQTTYQVSKDQRVPSIREAQQPYIFSFRSPSIVNYQTTYNHQQPATGFLPVTIVENVARASELITGFGADVDIANDENSLESRQQGASSIICVEDAVDTFTPGEPGQLLGSASASGSMSFKIAPISSGSNDYGLYVKSGSSQDFAIGNMSSNLSNSFSYLTITNNNYNLIYRLNNIGNGRVQCKLNFPNPTASPYNINTSSSGVGWHSNNITTNRGYTSGVDLDQTGMACQPIQWPQTSIGTSTSSVGAERKFLANSDTPGNTLSTSYQTVASSGHGVVFNYRVTTTNLVDGNEDGLSTIFEFIVKDVDTNTEYTIDLLCVFTMMADVTEEDDDDDDDGA